MRLFYLILVSIIFTCKEDNKISDIPSIKFIGMSKNLMIQGDLNQDSVLISLEFEDGDGDLSSGSESTKKDIFVIDKRTGLLSDQFKIPDIPDSNGEAVSGSLTVRLFNTCCLFLNNIPPCSTPVQYPKDSIIYEIYIVDRAGNESNRVLSSKLYLQCN
jgi:hypothetical protein